MQSSFFTAILLPLALAVVMLGMGLSLVPNDFKRITRYPKAVAVGTFCQIVVLPLLGALIATILPMPPDLAVGLIVVAVCPGGPSSNLITYLAKGDVALSVTLTAINSVITVFTIPILINLALQTFLGERAAIALPIGSTMLQIVLITLLPIAIGMAIRRAFPQAARRLEKPMSRLASGLLALIIGLLLFREGSKLPGFLMQVGIGVLFLNLLAMLAGLLAGRLFQLPRAQQICLAIEVGIQNGTLAIAITAGLLNNPEMAVPAAVYSLLMYGTGFMAILYGRRLINKPRLSV
ncbi:bile acid:sodium symporter family protein [Synechococcus sp. CS-602]|uniref:bile acid:sodium symporter family protein n=1 Tax=Synechococcaceae TaxID=1890426 RepID=UPI0008FF5DC4|nr:MULTISPECIES: bile acid:sodium symporter family protein [Synechococcaceae]MCT4365074.1 bile acid:sodium symporter family protein [Candidatus Regnicoccus frigidus MAG-AL1]APD49192.1 bile acid:sodium symporter [Synechococcus sp. SynAce01]MCT0202112.1 bile acid:sodium symporter family protein [Synechococcus sp. CS-603]MCT0205708.1 bile acid:sodium symporter family protein [Synechococcus sp. CS-602]MCT0244891.1 bile acid:sodium symporter family protein [Synechococcus sp. CS-601]